MAGVPEMPAVPASGADVSDELMGEAVQARDKRKYACENTSPAGKRRLGADEKRVFKIAAAATLPNVVNVNELLQRLTEQVEALVEGQQALAQGLQQLAVRMDNERIRRFNRRNVSSQGHRAPLQPLHREQAAAGGGHALGALPPHGVFPADRDALGQLTAAQINELEEFYGQQFVGASVAIRRKAFSDYGPIEACSTAGLRPVGPSTACTAMEPASDWEQPAEGDALLRPSFDELPIELRLKCLAGCDWQTLARAACANRSVRALVSYLTRSPYWRSHVEVQPAVLCTEFADRAAREAACTKWAETLATQLCGRGKPDICFVFVSPQGHPHLPLILKALRSSLATCTVLAGLVTPGVLGRDTASGEVHEVDQAERVGLCVSVLHLPPGSLVQAAYIKTTITCEGFHASDWRAPEGELPPVGQRSEHPRTWLVLSDQHAHIDKVLEELDRRYPAEPVFGGMGGTADGAPPVLVGLPGRSPKQALHADAVHGTLVVAISGPGVSVVPLATRGMRCISQRYMVSRVNNNVDMAPVGRVTLVQQLQNCMPLATGAGSLNWVPIAGGFTPTSALVAALQAQGPGIAPRAPLFFGVRPPTTNRAEGADQAPMIMLQMHDPNNLMRTSGFISVQHPVDVGMVTAYYTPHPPLARQQLKDRLEEVRADLYDTEVDGEEEGGFSRPNRPIPPYRSPESIHTVLTMQPCPVYGCLMFPCVAKGSRYYDEQAVESNIIKEVFPHASFAGCFCNGEIGPTPPDELEPAGGPSARFMGLTTVACMLKLLPAPPPPAEWAEW
ncbi:F-box only 22-like isoform B [Chlorella sorokiniana]|uniref:F-box only 22-like isoform B n=1 Tax=Chlorella sorokiniana TaxID=3076 RepID=A0A2P6TVS8_CHLSO|nr:F-box only 22-like isoform B [Chlorella sorokiniana]|eukprot:PRW58162.1 F-box only 22-like isoform B [Chlorella sorokiniana]